jgi:cysteine-rich repeat protein
MKNFTWLAALAFAAGCSFGDNNAARSTGHHACGDGIVDPGEGCDDGNTVSGDGCSATCTVETPHPMCGNGIKENGEQCDDGNTTNGDGCSATCTKESVCGNGIVEPGEQCDDGNTASGDGCSPTCQIEPQSACALLPQGGCSGATPACDLTAADDGTTGCRAVTAQGTSNDHCTVDTACKDGYTCVHDGNGDTPWCSRFCAHDSDCLGTGSRCVDDLTDDMGNSLHVETCSNACDPYGQSGCPSGMGCLGFDSTGGDYTDCEYMGNAPDGSQCANSIECLPGSACSASADDPNPSCEPTCIVGNDDTCDTDEECVGFTSPIMIGTVEYGACEAL